MAKRQGGKSSPAGGGTRSRRAGADSSQKQTAEKKPAAERGAKDAAPGAGKAEPGKKAASGAPPPGGPRRPGHRAALWLLVILLAGGAVATVAWSVWPYVGPELAALITPQAQSDLQSRITRVEDRMAALELSIRDLPDPEELKLAEATTALVNEKADGLLNRVGALESSVDELESSVAGLRAAVEDSPTEPVASEARQTARRNAAQLETLQTRVADLEETSARLAEEAARKRHALVVAVGQLGEALRGSGPFADELETLRLLGEKDPKVADAAAALSARAGRGIPALPELRTRFARIAGTIVQAAAGTEGGDWIDDAVSRVSSLVQVRRTGAAVPGDTPEALVARAEAHLEDGNLAGAVQELEALSGPAAAAAADWLADARARLEAERTLDALRTHVVARLAADEAETQPDGSEE